MAKMKHLPQNTPLPEWFLDELQEFLSTYVSPNFAVSINNPTTLQVVAGAGNAQVAVAIGNPADTTQYGWRWNTATATAAAPGTLVVGDNDVYVIASANGPYVANGSPPPTELDSTTLTFGLIVLPPGTPPSGLAAQAYYRKVATASWSGTAFTGVKMLFGGSGSGSLAGTLALRPPAAGGNSGQDYVATDDHGGTTYRSDGTVWTKKAAAVNGEWPLGACVDWPWAAGSIPAYTLLPYGQSILRASYPDLATIDTASGTPHGVVASNIVMPDYRGRIGAGKDDMGGAAANRITVAVSGVSGATLGAVLGAEGITLTTGQLPAHSHGVTGAPGISDPGHGTTLSTSVTWIHGGSNTVTGISYVETFTGGHDPGTMPITANAASTGITATLGSLATANAGSGSAHQNVQPTIIVNKLMRVL